MAITRTARGTGQNKASADPWTVMTTFVGSVNNLVVVIVASDPSGSNAVVTITQSGKTTTTLSVSAEANNIGNVVTRIYAAILADSYTAGSLIIDWDISGAPAAMAAAAIELAGANGTPMLDVTAVGTGTATAADTGSITSTPNSGADVAWVGAVGTEGPDGDTAGTWVNPNNAGQRLGTTGGGAASNVTVSEGYEIVSVEVTQALSKTGMTSRDWAAVMATYKEPAAVTFLAGKTIVGRQAVNRAATY